MAFKEVGVESLQFNPFSKIGKQWTLITAGDERGCNTMTASWGGFGVLWGQNVATVYIRPQRCTKGFVDESGRFTLSFLGEEHRSALKVCGSVSGRDVDDKFAQAGLTPLFVDGTTAVEEAELVLVCRTLYIDQMPPENFVTEGIDERWYPQHDYHFMYIAAIERVLVRK